MKFYLALALIIIGASISIGALFIDLRRYPPLGGRWYWWPMGVAWMGAFWLVWQVFVEDL